jgi:hemoglobin/transferrin/lactoferrin receptor protein
MSGKQTDGNFLSGLRGLENNKFLIVLAFLFFSNNVFGNIYNYTVTVIDENGQPMIGVLVFTDDQQKVYDVTDFDGKVVLKNMKYNYVINFHYIGYEDLRLEFFEIRNTGGIVRMQVQAITTQEIVVIGRRDDIPENVPYHIQKVDKKDIALTNSQTAADALRDHGGVFIQKSQMGGGSPIVRGFEANRVLLVVDGVRLNNAIYRDGHLQNAITIDNSMLERIEVIYGPGSLMYGSDALGGVVHFRSKDPKLHFANSEGKSLEGNAYTRYSSANTEVTTHVDLNYGTDKWASLSSFSFTSFGDLRAGSNRPESFEHFGQRQFYLERKNGIDQLILNAFVDTVGVNNDTISYFDIQEGTGYSQWDMMQKVRFQPNDKLYFIANLQFSSSTDVPRYDQLTELTDINDPTTLKFSEWNYGPQKRFMASLKTRILQRSRFYDKAMFIASFQKINEDRLKRKRDASATTFNIEDVQVYSLTGDFDKAISQDERLQMTYGFDINHNTVDSRAGNKDKDNGFLYFTAPTRYPSGGSSLMSLGAYANTRWKSRDSILNVDAGLRYSYVDLHSKFVDSIILWPQAYRDGIGTSNGALTYGFGATMNTRNKFQIRVLAASAFRSPNVDDFGKIRAKSNKTTIPNPDLKPEYSWTGELTIGKEFGKHTKEGGTSFMISTTGFYTYLKDAMVRLDFANPDGSTTLFYNNEFYETLANMNAENASVYGFSGNVVLHLGKHFNLKSSINYTKGRQTFRTSSSEGIKVDTLVPFAHIPPLYGQTALTFANEKLTLSVVARYQGKKTLDEYNINDISINTDGTLDIDREGSSDNLDQGYYKIVDGEREYIGTLAWTTYNFYGSYKLSKKWTIDLAMENILDLHYRSFASGLSSPGRNIIGALRMKF